MKTAQHHQTHPPKENIFVADNLRYAADQLEQQTTAQFRVRAYREAASFVAKLPRPIRAIYERDGRRGLEGLPTIGTTISGAIAVLLDSETWNVLDRLGASADHSGQDQSLSRTGPYLAHSNRETRHAERFAAVPEAAGDGRLVAVKQIGPPRLSASVQQNLRLGLEQPCTRQRS